MAQSCVFNSFCGNDGGIWHRRMSYIRFWLLWLSLFYLKFEHWKITYLLKILFVLQREEFLKCTVHLFADFKCNFLSVTLAGHSSTTAEALQMIGTRSELIFHSKMHPSAEAKGKTSMTGKSKGTVVNINYRDSEARQPIVAFHMLKMIQHFT